MFSLWGKLWRSKNMHVGCCLSIQQKKLIQHETTQARRLNECSPKWHTRVRSFIQNIFSNLCFEYIDIHKTQTASLFVFYPLAKGYIVMCASVLSICLSVHHSILWTTVYPSATLYMSNYWYWCTNLRAYKTIHNYIILGWKVAFLL